MSTRGVSRGVRRIIIMQRLHEEDLSGHVLRQGGWDHLCLPMRYSGINRSKTKLGFIDPRQTQGELLSSKQFTEEMVGKLENALGPYATAGQLGQDPVPRKGGFFKVENVEIVDASPPMAEMKVVRYWDTGGTTTGDPSAGVKLAKHKKNGLYYVLDVVWGQWASEERRKIQRQMADLDYAYPTNYQVTQIQSEDPGAAGKDQAADFIKLMHGYSCKTMRETGEKTTRADAFSAQLNVGNVKLLRGDWNKAYIDELRMFPNGKNDDQVDASAGAFNWLENRSGKSFLPDGWKF
jgi:predicted phage terminase large subunit-like protein